MGWQMPRKGLPEWQIIFGTSFLPNFKKNFDILQRKRELNDDYSFEFLVLYTNNFSVSILSQHWYNCINEKKVSASYLNANNKKNFPYSLLLDTQILLNIFLALCRSLLLRIRYVLGIYRWTRFWKHYHDTHFVNKHYKQTEVFGLGRENLQLFIYLISTISKFFFKVLIFDGSCSKKCFWSWKNIFICMLNDNNKGLFNLILSCFNNLWCEV